MAVFPVRAVELAGSPKAARSGQSVQVACSPAANLAETGPVQAACSAGSVEVARSPVENSPDYQAAANSVVSENYPGVGYSALEPVGYPAVALSVACPADSVQAEGSGRVGLSSKGPTPSPSPARV